MEGTPLTAEPRTIFCPCCSTTSVVSGEPSRDGNVCSVCGSVSRDRYLVLTILGAIASVSLGDPGRELSVLGVTGNSRVGDTLTRMLSSRYVNSGVGAEPAIDLRTVPLLHGSTFDIVVCSEQLQHEPAPVSAALEGLWRLVAPGGVAVISLPHRIDEPHEEHFPELTEARVEVSPGVVEYVGLNESGVAVRFSDLVIYGGLTGFLEHRMFNVSSLREGLLNAGFESAEPLMRNHGWAGAEWEPWSRVWLARRAG